VNTIIIKIIFVIYDQVNKFHIKDHLNYEEFTECEPITLKQFIGEAKGECNYVPLEQHNE
jgi:hypothetical protein